MTENRCGGSAYLSLETLGVKSGEEDELRKVFVGVDLDKPSVARAYAAYLGDSHNSAADREMVAAILDKYPWAIHTARANRAFLERLVTDLTARGVSQFLDVGSGIPTARNVHEVAQELQPQARVVYVDHDAVAVQMSRQLLAGNRRTLVVQADMADVDTVLDRAGTLLDLGEPVGLIGCSALMYVPNDRIAEVLAGYRAGLVRGSYLGISHTSFDEVPPDLLDGLLAENETAAQRTGQRMNPRSYAEILGLFGDWQLLPPGLVYPAAWLADREPRYVPDAGTDPLWRVIGYAGLAVKR